LRFHALYFVDFEAGMIGKVHLLLVGLLAVAGERAGAQESELAALPPVGRARLAAVHAKTDLKSGAGRGRITVRTEGKTVETIVFQTTFKGDQYAVTARYPLPRKGAESITMETMVSDGDLTFATRFSARLREGYDTQIWHGERRLGRNGPFSPAEVFPYDVTKLAYGSINVPKILDKSDVKILVADDAQVQMTYLLGSKTRCTLLCEGHSGFNVTELIVEDGEGPYHISKIGWEREADVWYVRRLQEKWFARERLKSKDRERIFEYDDFEPNAEVDEKPFDLSRVIDGWYNERIMYPHGKP
jgi:hypothetical protein